MLDFVRRHYPHVLRAEELSFIRDFLALDKAAQCLYVRLVNRKGRVFRARRLRYPEIGNLEPALAELRNTGFALGPGPEHFEDVLRCLTRNELIDHLAPACVGISRSLRKPEYVEFALTHADRERFLSATSGIGLFVQGRLDIVEYLLFLYFGKLPDGLSQFTMRDLGLTRVQDPGDHYEPRFNEREEAEENYYFCRELKRVADTNEPAAVLRLAGASASWPEPVYPGAARLRDDLAYKLGRQSEKLGDDGLALTVYARGESARCRERRVRLLLKRSDRDAARRLLEACIENPASDSELLFARDVFERKFAGKRTAETTDLLRAAETIDLDESAIGAPESAAVRWFQARGYQAFRVENTLWRMLFGLVFWDELFASNASERHSPFEWLPASLSDGSFYLRHQERVETKLGKLSDSKWLKQQLLLASTRHYGTANGMFRWRRTTIDALLQMVDHLDTGNLAALLRQLCQRYNDVRHGYPDLLVIDDAGARFVEIKTDGDLIRPNQRSRLEQLRQAGLRADIVRVRWILDPEQTYVVVDVETTGGKGDEHRMTEVGAVKVRNGVITDRFHSLLNPQRSIPGSITRLTGISQEMVASAPTFGEIADDFENFLADGIFVAHNVGFDYRFVAAEFARLGRTFRRARLCTCSGMRKHYPGHRSYSLASLCSAYDIPLKQHHRALCDAEAAAQLLLIINERRLERLAETALPPG